MSKGSAFSILTPAARDHAIRLVDLSLDALPRFVSADGTHRFKQILDGTASSFEDAVPSYSHPGRYPLMVRLGLAARIAALPPGAERDRATALDALYARCPVDSPGSEERALALWLAAETGAPEAASIPDAAAIRELDTQAVAWWLSAVSAAGMREAATLVAAELLERQASSGLFRGTRERGDVTFNAQAYSVLALSMHREPRSLDAAIRAAARLVALQGPLGQWWWVYDPDSGAVADRYPVYAVHQAGMGPMALAGLAAAGGPAHHDAFERSLAWCFGSNELRQSIVEPGAQAMHRAIRRAPAPARRVACALHRRGLGMLSGLWPGKELNRETRSYEYGWALRALGPLVG